MVAALKDAADKVFGPVLDPNGPERGELGAAVAEVAQRADNPQNVNRLIAAAVRLREAHRVLTAANRRAVEDWLAEQDQRTPGSSTGGIRRCIGSNDQRRARR